MTKSLANQADQVVDARPVFHQIEALTREQIEPAVQLHLRAFPDFFLSFLGPRFLKEFYAAFLDDPTGMGFVACARDGRVLGAVVGALTPQGFFKRLVKRRWWTFCLASAGAVCRRPACAPRLVRALFYRGGPPAGPSRALLSSIAVSPSVQGQGVGRALAGCWVEEARKRGAAGCCLTTDAEHNDPANAFYRSLGWNLHHTYNTPEGRKMNYYTLDFGRTEKP